MRTRRNLVAAALVGAATSFAWGGLSHMVLLKGVGFSVLRDEPRLVAALREAAPEDGLYFLPSIDLRGSATAAETASWEARFRRGPRGLLVVQHAGDSPMSARKVGVQALSHLLASFLVAWLLSMLVERSLPRRALVAGALGAFGCLAIGAIDWAWYGFPDAFFAARCVDQIVGWTLAGAAIAASQDRLRARGTTPT